MNNPSIQQKTQRGTRWSAITEVCARVIVPLTNMILARLLTPEAFGLVATAALVTGFADLFSDAGFQKYLIQHSFRDREDFFKSTNVAFWTNLAISLGGWGLIFRFAEPLAAMLGAPGQGKVIWISALSLPLTAFSSIQMAHFRREFRFRELFWVRMVSAAVPLVVTVPLAFLTRSFWSMVIGTLAGNLVNVALLTAWSEWKPGLYYSFARLKTMFRYSWWVLLESVLVWLTTNIGTFLVGLMMTQTEVGLYKTGMTTGNQILSLITAATTAPLFSALSALKDNEEEFQQMYLRYIRAIGVFVIPLGMGMYVFREALTAILLGDQWGAVSEFIGLWGLCGTLTLVWGTYCNAAYNARGKPQLSVLAQVLHLVVLIPVIFWGCRLGLTQLCRLRSLVRLEIVAVQMVLMSLTLKIRPGRYMKGSLPALALAGLMALTGTWLRGFSPSVWWQLTAIGLCAGEYLGLYWLLRREELKDALRAFGLWK